MTIITQPVNSNNPLGGHPRGPGGHSSEPLPVAPGDGLSNIEQVHARACETPGRPTLRGINHDLRQGVYFQPRCGSWSCQPCAEINRAWWALRTYHGAEELSYLSKPVDFLTLTCHEKLNPAGTLAVWQSAWRKLHERARRASGGFAYLMVAEQHQDGRLHWHAIETANLGTRWWKDNGRGCGLGYMAEEEEVRTPGGAANYVSKYLNKSLCVHTWPKGFRRVRTSQSWPMPEPLPPVPGWAFEQLSKAVNLAADLHHWERLGYDMRLLNDRQAWDFVEGQEEV